MAFTLSLKCGETVLHHGSQLERIVRVGTNTSNRRFPERVMMHYTCGREKSVFRRHLGRALLNRNGATPAQIKAWGTESRQRKGLSYHIVEDRTVLSIDKETVGM